MINVQEERKVDEVEKVTEKEKVEEDEQEEDIGMQCDRSAMLFNRPPKRVTYMGPDEAHYSPYVLVNNWVEEQLEYQKLPRLPEHFKSVTGSDFRKPFPTIPVDHKCVPARAIQHTGSGHNRLFNHEGDLYENNMTSTYDLSYNQIPKLPRPVYPRVPNNCPRIREPQLLDCYGNTTKHGLVDYKRHMWELEEKGKYNMNTEYMSRYPAPKPEDFETKRIAIRKCMSSAMHETNTRNKDLKFRGRRIGVVPTPDMTYSNALVEKYKATGGPTYDLMMAEKGKRVP